MSRKTINIAGTEIILDGEADAQFCLVQPVDADDDMDPNHEAALIRAYAGTERLAFIRIRVRDCYSSLSPWKAPAVFRRGEDFGEGAAQTLSLILETLLPEAEKSLGLPGDIPRIIGGYSFTALFALWAGYNTNQFRGVAAPSPSVWFPGWDGYAADHAMQAGKVYLSLGTREKKTRNPQMAAVADRIQQQYELLAQQLGEDSCTLEWNPGNHFEDTDIRRAKAYAWVIRQIGQENRNGDKEEKQ